MNRLKPIKPGDLIAVVAPAGKVTAEQVMPAINWLTGRGYAVMPGNRLLGNNFQYSGTDEERAGDLQIALDDPDVKAIIFARGGYGTIRTIGKINFDKFKQNPKWLAGFSDITILHNICAQMGFQSMHCAMMRDGVGEDGVPTESFQKTIRALEGENPDYFIESHELNREGKITAQLTGGNLSLLYSLIGTPYDLDTNGKILFIEEIGEYLYHIDRMMISLKLSGRLEGLKGLVVGQFTDVKDNPEPFGKTVEEIISDAVLGYDFPVCFGMPASHGTPNLPLVFGAEWKLTVSDFGVQFRMLDQEIV